MYVYGRNVLKEIINTDYPVKKVYFSNSENMEGDFNKLVDAVKNKKIPYEFTDNNTLYNYTQERKNQGVVIKLGKTFNYGNLEDYLDKENPFFIILDQIQDPHNFGAIIRTAVAAGVTGIVISNYRSAEVTPAVVKVSAGQIFKIPIIMETNLSRAIEKMKEKNIWVYSADMNGKNYYDVDYTGGLALVLGNEGSGVRENIKNHSDGIISIPMENSVESLNVSVSAAIVIFEAKKQRK